MKRYTFEDGDDDDDFKVYMWIIVIAVLFAAFVASMPIFK